MRLYLDFRDEIETVERDLLIANLNFKLQSCDFDVQKIDRQIVAKCFDLETFMEFQVALCKLGFFTASMMPESENQDLILVIGRL